MHSTSQVFAFIEGIGGPELMMIMFIVLLLFGGKKLPELAKGLGKSMREFKKAASGVEEEFRRAIDLDDEVEKAAPKINPPVPQPKPAVEAAPAAKPNDEPPARS